MINALQQQISAAIETKQALLADHALLETLLKVVNLAIATYKRGNKILIAGNGGSAADAQHFAAELVGRFYLNRPALPAIALTTDSSILTAVANDFGYNEVFARQVAALGVAGDLFIGISTSGNSSNILQALQTCKDKNIHTVSLTGRTPSKLNSLCDYTINVPSNDTPRIQESHLLIEHIICNLIEQTLFSKPV